MATTHAAHSGGPTVVLLGCNHRSAPLEWRERLAVPDEALSARLARVREGAHISEAAILSTCNRVEYYAVSDHPQPALDWLREIMGHDCDIAPAQLDEYLYALQQPDSVEHLAAVASSLDSMVLGEAQILGQVKRAYARCNEAGATGQYLHELFQRAFSVAKTIRTVTEIARHPVSVSSVAVDLAHRILGQLQDKSVLLIGAGKMPELCLKCLRDAGVTCICVANRTLERAQELARPFNGAAVPFEQLDEAISRADIVISSTASTQPILDLERMRHIMGLRRHRPLFLVDIAVPRDVDPRANELGDLYLFDIDSLQEVAGLNRATREAEAQRCLQLIRAEMKDYHAWQQVRGLAPTFKDLQEKMRRLGEEELARLLPKLQDPADKAILEKLVHRLVGKFLNYEIRHIRETTERFDPQQNIELARRVYELEADEYHDPK